MAKRVIKFGNDIFSKVTNKKSQKQINISYWNIWIAIILQKQFSSDWQELIKYLKDKHNHSQYEGMVTHIKHFQKMLAKQSLTIPDLLSGLDEETFKKQAIKARRKILELGFYDKEKSKEMHLTPRKLAYQEALQGIWKSFPVNPNLYLDEFNMKFKTETHYNESQTLRLSEKLRKFFDKKTKKMKDDEALAFHRAGMTVLLENMDNIDDSYGDYGMLTSEVIKNYISIDCHEMNINIDEYYLDLIRFLIWEDYGSSYSVFKLMFKNLSPLEIKKMENLLREEQQKLCQSDLDYHSEKALTYLCYLYSENLCFERFVPIANEMGTRAWQRIEDLAKTAEKNKKYKLACDVYEAALKDNGYHADSIRKKYHKLKKKRAHKM